MALKDEFTYTYEDLEKAMNDLAHHKGELKKWEDMRNTSQRAADSHQKFVDSTQLQVERAQMIVNKILKNLGK